MPRGVIKFFNERRGYGFIEPDEVSIALMRDALNDVYVHYSQINDEGHRTLVEGQEVTFELIEGYRGLEAVNVQKLP